MKVNLIVLKTASIDILVEQYTALGIVFEYHQHGKGPFHYSANCEELIFEIYEVKKIEAITTQLRLGFEVKKLDDLILKLIAVGWAQQGPAKQSTWGYRVVMIDKDLRKVELVEKE